MIFGTFWVILVIACHGSVCGPEATGKHFLTEADCKKALPVIKREHPEAKCDWWLK